MSYELEELEAAELEAAELEEDKFLTRFAIIISNAASQNNLRNASDAAVKAEPELVLSYLVLSY